MKDMTTDVEEIAKLPVSFAIVVRGTYGQLIEMCKDIEDIVPPGANVIYKRYSPGRLFIVDEAGEK